MTDDDFTLISNLSVDKVNIRFSMKRSVAGTSESWHGFEASESWTLSHTQPLTPAQAKQVAIVHAPALIKNVAMALHVGGVLPFDEAKKIIDRVRRIYGLVGGVHDPAGDQSGLSGAGESGGPAGARPGAGATLPDGPDGGVPGETEPDY